MISNTCTWELIHYENKLVVLTAEWLPEPCSQATPRFYHTAVKKSPLVVAWNEAMVTLVADKLERQLFTRLIG